MKKLLQVGNFSGIDRSLFFFVVKWILKLFQFSVFGKDIFGEKRRLCSTADAAAADDDDDDDDDSDADALKCQNPVFHLTLFFHFRSALVSIDDQTYK